MRTTLSLLQTGISALSIVLAATMSTMAQATATVVVYRPAKLLNWGVKYNVFNDKQELCRLNRGSYLVTMVPAGIVTLRSSATGLLVWPLKFNSTLRFSAQAGETYFVQADVMGYNLALAPATYAINRLQRVTLSNDCGPLGTMQP